MSIRYPMFCPGKWYLPILLIIIFTRSLALAAPCTEFPVGQALSTQIDQNCTRVISLKAQRKTFACLDAKGNIGIYSKKDNNFIREKKIQVSPGVKDIEPLLNQNYFKACQPFKGCAVFDWKSGKRVYDLEKGAYLELPKKGLWMRSSSSNIMELYDPTSKQTSAEFNFNNINWVNFEDSDYRSKVVATEDDKGVFVLSDEYQSSLYQTEQILFKIDLENKTLKKFAPIGNIWKVFPLAGQNKILAQTQDRVLFLDTTTGKWTTKLKIEEGSIDVLKWLPDQQALIHRNIHDNSIKIWSYNKEAWPGKNLVQNDDNYYKKITFSPKNKRVIVTDNSNTNIVELESSKKSYKVNFGLDFQSDFLGLDAVLFSKKNQIHYLDLASQCINTSSLTPAPNIVACDFESDSVTPKDQELWMGETLLNAKCSQDFTQKLWTPEPRLSDDKLSPLSLSYYLRRFQKPGGFEPQKHLPYLLQILSVKSILQKNPQWIAAIMNNVLSKSNLLYYKLMSRYPEIAKYVNLNMGLAPCQTKKEEDQLRGAVVGELNRLFESLPENPKWSDLSSLEMLLPLLSSLTSNEKDFWIDQFTQKLTDSAVDSQKFHDLFISKIYHLILPKVSKLFGVKEPSRDDLDFTRGTGFLNPLILASEPIDQDPSTDTGFGFYTKEFPRQYFGSARPGEIIFNKKLKYDVGTGPDIRSVSKNFKISFGTQKNIMESQQPSPNYTSMFLKTGGFSGLVLFGSSFSLRFDLSDYYQNYYLSNGYSLEKDTFCVEDSKETIAKWISQKQVNYLVKEAHADGDDYNLFKLDSKTCFKTFFKKSDGGQKDRVIIEVPRRDGLDPIKITNKEFASWIDLRGLNGPEDCAFFYLNTSCWSYKKVINELSAVNSACLTDIAAETVMENLTNESDSALKNFMDGFLSKESYQQIRERLKFNPLYRKGEKNKILLPDEAQYKNLVLDRVKFPIISEVDE